MKVISENDQGKELYVCVGDKIRVTLPGEVAAFEWQLCLQPTSLALETSVVVGPMEEGVGGGHRRDFTFIAVRPGAQRLEFLLAPPFAKDDPNSLHFDVTICVSTVILEKKGPAA